MEKQKSASICVICGRHFFGGRHIRYLVLTPLLFLSLSISAQSKRSEGVVTDSVTKQNLAFVNIVVNNDGHLGTTSDIDGRFSLVSENDINTLTFFFVGYEPKTINISPDIKNLRIRLKPINIELQEVIVHAGENPAHRIIDSLLRHRDDNNPKKLSYSYTMYDRMVLTLDTLNFNDKDSMQMKFKEEILRKEDLMIMETVSENFHQLPSKDRKNILATKISGMKDPLFFYVLDEVQSSSFYDDFITVFSKKYVNPISNGSKNKYFFNIESVIPTSENDTVYQISFKPRRNTNFDALKGVLTIHSDGWALQNVKAEPADENALMTVKIQQKYEKIDSIHWFPRQLNTDIIFTSAVVSMNGSSVPIIGVGKSYISDIKINPQLAKNTFSNIAIDVDPNAGFRDEKYWFDYRYDSLNERILNTYKLMDSLGEEANFDAIGRVLQSMSNSAIPFGKFNLDLDKILDFNVGNKLYLGLGGSTNDRFSRFFKVGAFWGYWFGAKSANYGGEMSFLLKRSHNFRLTFFGGEIFERFGDYGFNEANSSLNTDNYKYLYVDKTTLNTKVSAEISTIFTRHFKGFVKFSVEDIYSREVTRGRVTTQDLTPSRVTTLEFKLRFAFNEKFMQTTKGVKSLGSRYPIVWLSYQKNLQNVFDSPYNFDKMQIQIKDDWSIRYLGKTSIMIQAGIVDGDMPLFEAFNMFGTWMEFDLYAPGSFNTMRIDEFLCDRFAALFFTHNFGSLLFQRKNFKPELIVTTNIGWGDIKDQYLHQDIDFSTMENGYFESGLIIDNLLSTPISKIGLGAFYRYGAYSFDEPIKNFAFRFSISIALE